MNCVKDSTLSARIMDCSRPYRLLVPKTHCGIIMDAEYSMPEPIRLDPALKKVCNILLGLGAAVLTLDRYLGFVKHANSALVFSLLGITTVVFAPVLFMLLQPSAFAFLSSAKSAPEPKATVAPEPKDVVNPEPEATVASEPKDAVEAQPKAEAIPQ